jgi:hypothetical protein
MCRAVFAVPLLFVVACMDMPDGSNAENSTSQVAEELSAPVVPVPGGGPTQDPRSSASASPSISPSADFQFAAAGGSYSCASGTLCAGAWDPSVNQWKVFKLFTCHTYSLNNWNGVGFFFDNQTGNPLSSFFDQSMQVISSFRPGNPQANVNWDPVWFIKNC